MSHDSVALLRGCFPGVSFALITGGGLAWTPVKDPLRIPGVLDALRRAWEAQPDLTLPQLYGQLEARGIAWNSTDREVTTALAALSTEHPVRLADIPGAPDATRVLVITEQPDQRITLDGTRIAVRRTPAAGTHGRVPQPVVWTHHGIRRCTVGQPLVVLDTADIPHHLGLVASLTTVGTGGGAGTGPDGDAAGAATPNSLSGLRRRSLDGHVYLVELDGDEFAGTTVLVDRTLWLYDIGRRDVRTDHLSWSRLITAAVGEPLVVALQNGHTLRLPEVIGITVLE